MKFYMTLLFFLVFSNNLYSQIRDSTIIGVGEFNAPLIELKDPTKIDYALKKTLTENEYLEYSGLFIITMKIDSCGSIKDVLSIKYKRGEKLCLLNEEIFKLNLKKYVTFLVPVYYIEIGLTEFVVSQVYRKFNDGRKKDH
ncbi:hypothetical protein [uncultured Bacteroides sp.]|uniref:hypothetical protein n=1 Tax=uncultured Bacteroides sp. TaxID=162156 RepID=UPI002AAAAFE8|nr:hypothetical protein [uncultured Bacteroides sp.]